MMRHLNFPDELKITVRVTDDVGNIAETTAKAVALEGDTSENVMAQPRNILSECNNGEIHISWTATRPRLAKYILVKLNDVDLDYVPVENLTTTINNIDNMIEVTSIKVAWLDKDYETSQWADVELPCPIETNIEPVETGVGLANIPILLMISMAVLCTIIIYKKCLPH